MGLVESCAFALSWLALAATEGATWSWRDQERSARGPWNKQIDAATLQKKPIPFEAVLRGGRAQEQRRRADSLLLPVVCDCCPNPLPNPHFTCEACPGDEPHEVCGSCKRVVDEPSAGSDSQRRIMCWHCFERHMCGGVERAVDEGDDGWDEERDDVVAALFADEAE